MQAGLGEGGSAAPARGAAPRGPPTSLPIARAVSPSPTPSLTNLYMTAITFRCLWYVCV